MALHNSPLLLFLVMVIDWIPGLSQVKSLCQAIAGDEEGARRTQENFSRQCPGISQLRSTVELVTGNPEAAIETQAAFVRNVVDITDAVPGVSQVKSLAQVTLGDEEAARRTQENFSRRCPLVSQLRSAGEAIGGDAKAARATQLEFIRNLGIPDSEKKNFYHYTNKRGAKAIESSKMIRASRDETVDAAFGKGVYFTSMDPRHFSSKELRRNNYDTSGTFYNSARFADKTDYVVEVWIPRDEIRKVTNERDVYLYEGDLDLDDYEYHIFIN